MSDQFEVGQRVYWPELFQLGFAHIPGEYRVASGVVVTTGPAISTIWVDECPGSPHMETKANDKVTDDRGSVVEKIAPENERITAIAKSVIDGELERLAAKADALNEEMAAPSNSSWIDRLRGSRR